MLTSLDFLNLRIASKYAEIALVEVVAAMSRMSLLSVAISIAAVLEVTAELMTKPIERFQSAPAVLDVAAALKNLLYTVERI